MSTDRSGWFHWEHGWWFKRGADGTVLIEHQRSFDERPLNRLEIPAAEWASIISHVSAGGEPQNYKRAVEFHASRDAPASSPRGEGGEG